MAAFAINSSAVAEWMESEIMVASTSPRSGSLSKVSPGLTMGELDRRVRDLDPACRLPRHGEGRGREIAGFGKIGAEMRAAGILALERGERNDAAHFAQRAQIEPVVPGQIERRPPSATPVSSSSASMASMRGETARDAGAVAHHADLVPHHVEQLLAQRIEIAGLAGEGISARSTSASRTCGIRRPMTGIFGNPAAA